MATTRHKTGVADAGTCGGFLHRRTAEEPAWRGLLGSRQASTADGDCCGNNFSARGGVGGSAVVLDGGGVGCGGRRAGRSERDVWRRHTAVLRARSCAACSGAIVDREHDTHGYVAQRKLAADYGRSVLHDFVSGFAASSAGAYSGWSWGGSS